jgi:hypothetical protein
MKGSKSIINGWLAAGLLPGALLIGIAGCANSHSTDTPGSVAADTSNVPPPAPAALTPAQAASTAPAAEQESFDTPDAAVSALLTATKAGDHDEIHKIFGPATSDLMSGDKVEDANDFKAFAASAAEKNHVEKKNDNTEVLYVGNKDWPFPIPLVKGRDGKWFFDTVAGKDEILARRIGANELETIDVCHAFVGAERDYAMQDHDGSGVLKYAQHFKSTPGKKDGLYWEAAAGEPQSPLGAFWAQASSEGYGSNNPDKSAGPHPFHGYFYHILTKQGPDAAGGQYDYVINGNMIGGFALISWPDKYGDSGIMTFIVNHQGKVYQKDLGPNTDQIAKGITEFNPDSSWTLVQ